MHPWGRVSEIQTIKGTILHFAHLHYHQHYVVPPTLASVTCDSQRSLYPAGMSKRLHRWHMTAVGRSARVSSFGSAVCHRQHNSSPLRHLRTRHLSTRHLTACTMMSSSGGQQVLEWQRNTPYLLASEDKDFQIEYTASCMCGEVQYAVDCDPVAAKYCHCTSCQKLHGKLTTSASFQT